MRRWAVASILLCGCFAAQALWQDDHQVASAAKIDELVATLAVCPELIPGMQQQLDRSFGHLSAKQAERALNEGRACLSHRKQLNEHVHRSLAYSSLKDLIDQQQAKPEPAPARSNEAQTLKLSLSLGQP